MSEAKVHTENEDTEHKNLSKKSKKVTNISVLRVITEKFTKELNVLSWKNMTEIKNQHISIDLMKNYASQMLKNWCQSNHFILTEHIKIFANQILFYKCTAFTLYLQTKESKL